MKRIVLTGGPGAGKTAVSSALAARHPGRYLRIPEAATLVYDLLRTRWDILDDAGRRDVQRRIYQVQREQEDAAATHGDPDQILLLDRGTVDGSGYWPEGPDDYWRALGTTAAAELARYDAVLWLQTCATVPGLYDGSASNPSRHEPPAQAIASGEKMHALWRPHPHFFEIDTHPTLEQKIAAVAAIVETV